MGCNYFAGLLMMFRGSIGESANGVQVKQVSQPWADLAEV